MLIKSNEAVIEAVIEAPVPLNMYEVVAESQNFPAGTDEEQEPKSKKKRSTKLDTLRAKLVHAQEKASRLKIALYRAVSECDRLKAEVTLYEELDAKLKELK